MPFHSIVTAIKKYETSLFLSICQEALGLEEGMKQSKMGCSIFFRKSSVGLAKLALPSPSPPPSPGADSQDSLCNLTPCPQSAP